MKANEARALPDEERRSLLAALDEEEEGGASRAGASQAGAAIAKSKRVLGDTLRVADGVADVVARDGDVLRAVYNRLRAVDDSAAEAAGHLRAMEWVRLRRRALVPCVLAATGLALALAVWLFLRRH